MTPRPPPRPLKKIRPCLPALPAMSTPLELKDLAHCSAPATSKSYFSRPGRQVCPPAPLAWEAKRRCLTGAYQEVGCELALSVLQSSTRSTELPTTRLTLINSSSLARLACPLFAARPDPE